MAYESAEARKEAKNILRSLKAAAEPGAKFYHLGSAASSKYLRLPNLHNVRGLAHVGFGDFRSADKVWYFARMADTQAGRIYKRVKYSA